MNARTQFARHYLQVIGGTLGLLSQIDPDDGSVRVLVGDTLFRVVNTAPHDRECLRIEHTSDFGHPDDEIARGILARSAPRLCPTTTLWQHGSLVTARSETILAGPYELPKSGLLASVVPRLMQQLEHALQTYSVELTLTGILETSVD